MEEKFSIQPYLNDIEILNQTVEQIKKDFSFFDLPIIFTGNKETAFNELLSQIYPHIKKLMDSGHDKFFSLLYRVDISEKQIKSAQQDNSGIEIEKIISELIIKRCLQKVILRKLYSK